MTKKAKIIIGSASFAAVLLIIVIGLIVGYSVQRNTLNLIYTKDINIELDNQAHTISTYDFIGNENKDKLNAQFDNKSTSTEVMADSVYTADKSITVKYMNGALCKTQRNVIINVIDTTPPEFSEKIDSITINKGDEIDVVSKFKATDLSGEVEIKADSTVDVNTVGEQLINVSATDKNGNVSKAEVKITVIEKKEEQTESTKQDRTSSKNTTKNKNSATNGNTGNNKTSSNASSSSKPNSNTTTKPNNNNSNTTTVSSCANGNHSMPTGNSGKWFNSRSECQEYMSQTYEMWAKKLHNNEITREEYNEKCPGGYECWSCSNCGKWTLNYKYR